MIHKPVSGEPSQAECRRASGLVASSFQFFTRLAAVFAEEVDGFFFGLNWIRFATSVTHSA
ncbi:hypothetical protein OAG93_00485 [bacterium]|nr:hypothetical protein [bacterium]